MPIVYFILKTLSKAKSGLDPFCLHDPFAFTHRCLYTTINVNGDVVQAQRELRTFIESYYGIPYEVQATRNGLCTGSAEQCIAWLKKFIAAGAQTIVIRFGSPDQKGRLTRFAKEVLPHVGAAIHY